MELFLIRSDKDKDKEQSDKKTLGVCREYKDSIIHFLVKLVRWAIIGVVADIHGHEHGIF